MFKLHLEVPTKFRGPPAPSLEPRAALEAASCRDVRHATDQLGGIMDSGTDGML
jgi:hypothetical protein